MTIFIDRNQKTSFRINKDGRVNFVLSHESYTVIEKDRAYFLTNERSTLSGFLNSIFESLLPTFFVNQIIDEHISLYNSILSHVNSSFDSEKFNDAFKSAVIKKINVKLNDYDIQKNGGVPVKFKLNSTNVGLVRNYEYSHIFKNRSLAFFIRCVFESYARLSIGEREKLYYAYFINLWDRISNGNGIIKYEYKSKTELLVPYKIVFNENTQRHYALGFLPDFNIPRIRQLKNFPRDFKVDRGYFKLSTEQINLIEKNYIEHDLENINDNAPTYTYTVLFTGLGLEQFKKNTHGRPSTPSKIDADQKTFTSTDKEMLSYFLKFGPNVEILTPLHARELFKNVFKYSLRLYEKVNERG